jgi:PAS domain-containing protein
MNDDATSTAAAPADPDEGAALLAELRARIEEAAREIERLTTELLDRTRALDELESITDAVLEVTDTPVILAGEDRRLRAMSRGAAELLGLEGSAVGRALSKVLPHDAFDTVVGWLDAIGGGEAPAGGSEGLPQAGVATVRVLPGGDALVVLRRG